MGVYYIRGQKLYLARLRRRKNDKNCRETRNHKRCVKRRKMTLLHWIWLCQSIASDRHHSSSYIEAGPRARYPQDVKEQKASGMGKPINDSNMAKAMNLIDLRKRLKRPETPKYELASDNLRHEYR